MPLFAQPVFDSFGPSRFIPGLDPTCTVLTASSRIHLQREVRAQCPLLPGVYGMVEGQGELLYVGKAKRLRVRLLSYFRRRGHGATKARNLLRRTRRIIWQPMPHDFLAWVRELELIRSWRPRCNIMGQPQRRQRLFLALGRAPAPYLFLTPEVPAKVRAVFGPIPNHPSAHAAVEALSDLYRLRACPRPQTMVFREDLGLFPHEMPPGCLRYEIGLCLGPCAGLCGRPEYERQVRAVLAFLHGRSDAPLQHLTTAMQAAAAATDFEAAARLRDRLAHVRWLQAALKRTVQAQTELTGVYQLSGTEGPLWCLLRQGQIGGICPAPRDRATRRRARRWLRQVFQRPTALGRPDDISVTWLVSSWFRRYPEEKQHLRPVAALV